jgi:hypothetical protein
MRLYHFLSAENALDDLKNKRVKISIIEKLNDPFEFQAGFVKPNRTLREQFSKFKTNISKEFGIFCCSKTWQNPLLWSHYASKHTGIALGLNMPDSKATNVTYSKDRPLFTSDSLSKKSDNTEYLEKLSKTKLSSWSYEEDVRFIYPLNTLQFDNGHYFNNFDDQMILEEVIIGCKSDITKNKILTVLNGYKNIKLIWSRMAYKSFRIVRNQQKVFNLNKLP